MEYSPNCLVAGSAAAAASSNKEGPNSPGNNAHHTAEGSDEDEAHPCRWSGCDTSATSLDQLIVHIKDAHIGSGKVRMSTNNKIAHVKQVN